ncbi:MAG: fibrillin [Methanobacteriota archaeon]|jgi:fibrillarin-like rRNA methylase|nr:MAG: fibrillin [Euryarchaeota archaeon]
MSGEDSSSQGKIKRNNNNNSKAKNYSNLSWAVRMQRRAIWTINANPRKTVYGESLRRFNGKEYRRWDPRRSKLAAAMIRTRNNPDILLPAAGSQILYLGAGHGTTISHLHDHLCGADNRKGGRLVAVDLAPRCLRDLTHLAHSRKGLVPVLGDARKHTEWGALVPRRVNWLFQDVAQAGQVEIFLSACDSFLAIEGIALLSLKAASERWNSEGEAALFTEVGRKIEAHGLELLEGIKLTGYEDNHTLFVVRRKS